MGESDTFGFIFSVVLALKSDQGFLGTSWGLH